MSTDDMPADFRARLDILDREMERHAQHRDCWPQPGCLICEDAAPVIPPK